VSAARAQFARQQVAAARVKEQAIKARQMQVVFMEDLLALFQNVETRVKRELRPAWWYCRVAPVPLCGEGRCIGRPFGLVLQVMRAFEPRHFAASTSRILL
jgi:hypothetical protein